jgi:hypothetical protein
MNTANHIAARSEVYLMALLCALAVGPQNLVQAQTDDQSLEAVTPVRLDVKPAEEKIHEALLLPVEVDFVETSISDVVLALSDQRKITIVLDTRALEATGVGPDRSVTLSLEGVPLRSVLNIILRPYGLTWMVIEDVVLVTPHEFAKLPLVSQVYDVRDLMARSDDGRLDPDGLTDLITASVAPTSWDEVGGTGTLDSFDGSLVVRQTDDLQRVLQGVLTELRRAKHLLEHDPQQAFARRWTLSPQPAGPTTQRIEAALDKQMPLLEFIETPLAEVIDSVRERAGIPILIDPQALDQVGFSLKTPVTQRFHEISLGSGLQRMLHDYNLEAVVRDDVLWITTYEEEEQRLTTAAYLVRDLVDSQDACVDQVDDLIELITSTVAPTAWADVGGPGQVRYFSLLDALVIDQTDEVLQQVDELLAKLHKVRHAREPWSAERWQQRREQQRNTPELVHFSIVPTQLGRDAIAIESVRTAIEHVLAAEDLERASIKQSTSALSAMLTPREAAQVQRLVREVPVQLGHPTHGNPFSPAPVPGKPSAQGNLEGGFF